LEVGQRRVADVSFPSIVWVSSSQRPHDAIARDFRDDRSARDGVTGIVPANQCGVRQFERPKWLAIDDDMIRDDSQAPERATHRDNRRLINVDPVDLTHRCSTNADVDGALANLESESFAF